MVSRLRINMFETKLYEIGIDQYFLLAAAQFLLRKIDFIPFKFLGIMVGGNHMRVEFWKPIARSLKEKLSSRKGRMLLMGGRISLINSVRSNLPVYYFSFFKVPAKIT